ncbi:MAG: ABC transporter substrate-binding protein [Pontiellaceae bacterium]|nr:ABC transporter substrate-binding protein [Pontiellaceae bacterium]MBN2784602.1 ABC transporter substrate-binding protein [Pontiellaceae bacterium]
MGLKSHIKRLPKGHLWVLLGSLLLSSCGSGDLKSQYGEAEKVSFGVTPRIPGLDPVKAGSVSGALAISHVYEGLLQYDYLARPYKVVPMLAEAMPEISEDGLTYTFKIRKGIYFADDPCFPDGKGRELKAADFVYSIKRLADVKNSSTGFWTVGRIKGINEFAAASESAGPTDYNLDVEGLRALDDYTLQIKLADAYPQFLYVLTMQYAFVVPREAVEYYKKDFVNHPVGTGPYVLVDWRRNSRIEYARNPKWEESGRVKTYPSEGTKEQRERGLLKDAGKRLPMIDRVVQFVVQDQATAWMMFLSGELDSSVISRDNWDAVITGNKELNEALTSRGIELVSSPALDIRYIGFNMDDPIVGYSRDPEQNERNKKLRQALSCAYNFDQMNEFMNYRLYEATGPIPKPMAGYSEQSSPYAFDLEKARKLLAEAGYPEGIDPQTGRRLKLTMEVGSADDNSRQRMQLIVDMFDKINVVLEVSYNNWPAFLEKIHRRQEQVFELGWTADYPDAENFLQLFYGQNGSPGPNNANYRNAEFDALYETVRVMQDSPERTAMYEELAGMVVNDCPWIFQFQPMAFALVHGWVKNYEPHDFPYGMNVYRDLDIEQRKAWLKKFDSEKLNMRGGK